MIPLCILSCNLLFAKIMNGYESQIQSNKISLQELRVLLSGNEHLPLAKRLQIKSKIKNLISYISYYELTEELIHQLKIVSPGIFMKTDNIKDKRGRPTDIYIKLIPKESARIQLEAATFFTQAVMDEDANHSVYGDYSVAVEIWINNNALLLLSHELGHINYIVPNLAEYSKFYNKHYAKKRVNLSHIGHFSFDPSGKSADTFEKRLKEDEKTYLQNGGKKPEAFFALIIRIRRTVRDAESTHPDSTIARNGFF